MLLFARNTNGNILIMIQVLNKKDSNDGYYIGRGSPLGNPYDFTGSKHPQVKYRVNSRKEAIEGFSSYLDKELNDGNPEICDAINELIIKHKKKENIDLLCFCSPKSCHGEVIKKKIEESKYCINWFSNMKYMDRPLFYQGMKFSTAENFYAAMKTKDLEERRKISSMNPHRAKVYARGLDLRKDWADIKLDVMRYILKFKFAPDTSWGEKLKNYDKEIVEWNNWGDKEWGKSIYDNEGENWLGKILMEIRQTL